MNQLGLNSSKMAMKDSKKRCDLGNAVTLEQECKWRKYPGKYARGFAKGAESEFGPLAQMKDRCLSLGDACRTVTCKTDGNCRTSGTNTLSTSHSGETAYVPEASRTNWYVCAKAGRAKRQATLVPVPSVRLQTNPGEPEIFANGNWVPICGHWFWNNENGANTFCRQLGYLTGNLIATERKLATDAMYVGSCKAGEDLHSCSEGCCSDGCRKGSVGCGDCGAGKNGGITMTCLGLQGCEDHTFKKKEKWHDSDGPKYDCQWYQEDNRCKTFGDGYENEGLTANEACCACGGGWTTTTTTTTSTTTTATTTTLTGATYDYIQGKSDCVRVQATGQNLSAVEFSFKVKNLGNDNTWRPLWSAKWPGPIWPSIFSQSFDTAGKKKGTEHFKKWRLNFRIWLPLQNWYKEAVEFSTPFEFFHEYDVKILYSAELDKVKLFVHGEEKEDRKFSTPLCWMEVGSSVTGCDTNREIEFVGSVKSFKIESLQEPE